GRIWHHLRRAFRNILIPDEIIENRRIRPNARQILYMLISAKLRNHKKMVDVFCIVEEAIANPTFRRG
ncbi:hypothetical protein, partial [Escherichia coli]|uniref:hypothetical protein n=1 Tax=Escherichia coli TaxID=562 RepID=UPI001BD50F67